MKTLALASALPWKDIERVVILSPHLDDAALSCGGLLQFLRGREAACLVISVYCGNPPALQSSDGSRRTLQRKGYANPNLRRQEDIAAMHSADADFVHLGFPDSIYRRSPLTNQFIYQRARERWVRPRIDDLGHVEELYLVLQRLSLNLGRILLVSPMGIGQHVDHTIVARTALRLAEQGVSLLFYEDFPYVVDRAVGSGADDGPQQALQRLGREPVSRMVLPVDVAVKAALIGHYRSQIPALFDDDAGLMSALQSYRTGSVPSESYWKTRPIRVNKQEE